VTTADRIVDEARSLIMARGYNAFSYADIAATVGVSKANVHHHYAAKSDLATAVVERSRDGIRAQVELLATSGLDAAEQLRAYARYWERCILDGSAPFCIAAMLAAELPSLPADVATAVRAFFAELRGWLTQILVLGLQQGNVTLVGTPEEEADAFLSAVYGAMLSARAFGDPHLFTVIVETLLSRVVRFR
jgi:TetR/AcrR family transcriptional regulator, transcriptional repressor for nem operon